MKYRGEKPWIKSVLVLCVLVASCTQNSTTEDGAASSSHSEELIHAVQSGDLFGAGSVQNKATAPTSNETDDNSQAAAKAEDEAQLPPPPDDSLSLASLVGVWEVACDKTEELNGRRMCGPRDVQSYSSLLNIHRSGRFQIIYDIVYGDGSHLDFEFSGMLVIDPSVDGLQTLTFVGEGSLSNVYELEGLSESELLLRSPVGGPFQTFFERRPAVCGDGVTEQDEACDDANTTSGDGCSCSCDIETGSQALSFESPECAAGQNIQVEIDRTEGATETVMLVNERHSASGRLPRLWQQTTEKLGKRFAKTLFARKYISQKPWSFWKHKANLVVVTPCLSDAGAPSISADVANRIANMFRDSTEFAVVASAASGGAGITLARTLTERPGIIPATLLTDTLNATSGTFIEAMRDYLVTNPAAKVAMASASDEGCDARLLLQDALTDEQIIYDAGRRAFPHILENLAWKGKVRRQMRGVLATNDPSGLPHGLFRPLQCH